MFVFLFLVSCISIPNSTASSTVTMTKSDNMKFYIRGGDRLGLNEVIFDFFKENGYDAQIVLDIKALQRQSAMSSGTGFFISEKILLLLVPMSLKKRIR